MSFFKRFRKDIEVKKKEIIFKEVKLTKKFNQRLLRKLFHSKYNQKFLKLGIKYSIIIKYIYIWTMWFFNLFSYKKYLHFFYYLYAIWKSKYRLFNKLYKLKKYFLRFLNLNQYDFIKKKICLFYSSIFKRKSYFFVLKKKKKYLFFNKYKYKEIWIYFFFFKLFFKLYYFFLFFWWSITYTLKNFLIKKIFYFKQIFVKQKLLEEYKFNKEFIFNKILIYYQFYLLSW